MWPRSCTCGLCVNGTGLDRSVASMAPCASASGLCMNGTCPAAMLVRGRCRGDFTARFGWGAVPGRAGLPACDRIGVRIGWALRGDAAAGLSLTTWDVAGAADVAARAVAGDAALNARPSSRAIRAIRWVSACRVARAVAIRASEASLWRPRGRGDRRWKFHGASAGATTLRPRRGVSGAAATGGGAGFRGGGGAAAAPTLYRELDLRSEI